MTQLRKFRDSISNFFDEIERGVGKRGSTFTDVDAISHDKDTRRFLFREFKHDGEPLDKAQLWVLRELATLPRCTVWVVRKLENGHIGWHLPGGEESELTVKEYRRRLSCWWYQGSQAPLAEAPISTKHETLPAPCKICGEPGCIAPHESEISW